MKKIFLVIAFLCAAFCASAQYADPQLKVKRGHMYADGVKLDDAHLDNIFLMEYGSKNNIDSRVDEQMQKLLKFLKKKG